MRRVLVPHNDPSCTAGFSALVHQWLTDESPRRVELICWACGSVVTIAAHTPAADDPEAYSFSTSRDIPVEHRPSLAVGTSSTTSQYPASVAPDRVAGVVVYVEAWLDSRVDDAYEWLVADKDGNGLGVVSRYITDRFATRYRWGTWDDAAGHGDACRSRDAAVRRLAAAVAGRGDTR